MEVNDVVEGIKYGVGLYLLGYLGVSMHIAYDFVRHNSARVNQGITNQLEVRRYKVKVNGKEKYLTLVGEVHFYNKREHEIAERLVQEHQYFASERGNSLKGISFGNFLYAATLHFLLLPANFYSNLGSRRKYEGVRKIAEKEERVVFNLEDPNDLFNNLDFKGKAKLLGLFILYTLTAPACYYLAKNEKPRFNLHDSMKSLEAWGVKEALVDKRDKVMSKKIIELLEYGLIDDPLVVVGRGHLEGIVTNLSQQVKLEEIK